MFCPRQTFFFFQIWIEMAKFRVNVCLKDQIKMLQPLKKYKSGQGLADISIIDRFNNLVDS